MRPSSMDRWFTQNPPKHSGRRQGQDGHGQNAGLHGALRGHGRGLARAVGDLVEVLCFEELGKRGVWSAERMTAATRVRARPKPWPESLQAATRRGWPAGCAAT